MAGTPFESLDYIYVPAPDFEATVKFYTTALGGDLRWRIRDGEVWVAAVRVAGTGPTVLLASHLEPHQTILIYRVASIDDVGRRLTAAGWAEVEPRLEIPQGPCLVFRDPAGQRLAVYERVRPHIDVHFEGRLD